MSAGFWRCDGCRRVVAYGSGTGGPCPLCGCCTGQDVDLVTAQRMNRVLGAATRCIAGFRSAVESGNATVIVTTADLALLLEATGHSISAREPT